MTDDELLNAWRNGQLRVVFDGNVDILDALDDVDVSDSWPDFD